jgi:hypothetical protein
MMTVATQLKQAIASLKGARATLRFYGEYSRHEEARSAFAAALSEMDEIIADLEKRQKEIEFAEPQYKGT